MEPAGRSRKNKSPTSACQPPARRPRISDLIRNDLSMVATEVMVTRYRYIDELPTHQGALLQVIADQVDNRSMFSRFLRIL